jgi:hypothetical protein
MYKIKFLLILFNVLYTACEDQAINLKLQNPFINTFKNIGKYTLLPISASLCSLYLFKNPKIKILIILLILAIS